MFLRLGFAFLALGAWAARSRRSGLIGSESGEDGADGGPSLGLPKQNDSSGTDAGPRVEMARSEFSMCLAPRAEGPLASLPRFVDQVPPDAHMTTDYSHGPQYYTVGNTKWRLASKSMLMCIPNAMVLGNGLSVSGDGDAYTLGHWYWQRKPIYWDVYWPWPRSLESLTGAMKRARTSCTNCPAYFNLRGYRQSVYQHIAIDTLPRVASACDFLQSNTHVQVLVESQLQADLVNEVCQISPPSRFEIGTGWKHGAMVHLPQWQPELMLGLTQVGVMRPLGRTDLPSSLLMRGRAAVRQIVYLGRRAWTERSVVNEAELLTALHTTGAKVESLMDLHNWREDRVHFEGANYIIGPHGGAFANMIFASPGAVVVEFSPLGYHSGSFGEVEGSPTTMRPCFLGLAVALGLQFVSIPPEHPETFDYHLPMRANVSAVKEFFARESAKW